MDKKYAYDMTSINDSYKHLVFLGGGSSLLMV